VSHDVSVIECLSLQSMIVFVCMCCVLHVVAFLSALLHFALRYHAGPRRAAEGGGAGREHEHENEHEQWGAGSCSSSSRGT
jgi:hypothetical protein